MDTEAPASAPQTMSDPEQNWHPSGDEAGRLTIDLGAIASNWRHLAAMRPGAHVGVVVKADAYGLGAGVIAPMLAGQGARAFFVAHLAEGMALKSCLPPDASIYILNGLAPGGQVVCADAGLIPVLNTVEQARDWYAAALDRSCTLPAALQVDSGMSRLGLSEEEIDDLLSWPDFTDRISIRLLMTHMACADTPAASANAAQLASFARFSARLPSVPCSIANSAAAMLLPQAAGGVLRPGLCLYGVNPGEGSGHGLTPAIRLGARVIQVRAIPAGAGVGYGFDYVAETPRRVATVAAGYADGWPRALSSKGAVWFSGQRLPILGRVSMDSCVVDVTSLAEGAIRPGDTVELIGPHQPVEALASLLATTPHEILTSLGRRFTRNYLNPPSKPNEEARP